MILPCTSPPDVILAGEIEHWPMWPGPASHQKRMARPARADLANEKELSQ